MKYLLFGTGDYYERYKKWFAKDEIVALLDNAKEKQNTTLDGIRIMAPQDGVNEAFDVVVILSFYVREMKKQLIELGVSAEKIFHFYDLHKLLYAPEKKKPIRAYGASFDALVAQKDKKILLLSQDMTLGGPALALYHTAKTLIKNGYQIVFASMIDGPLREKLVLEGIPVIVDDNLQIETMRDAEWTHGFRCVFCNAINFCVYLSKRDGMTLVIWWLHDSAFFYDGISQEIFDSIPRENLKVCAVGTVPKEVLLGRMPDIQIENLIYGVEDTGMEALGHQVGEKVSFLTIGFVEARKGQDILVEAIKKLPADVLAKASFRLVGQNTSALANRLKTEIESLPQVMMTGPVGRERIEQFLSEADMMIIPSREDPMPTVAAEAMMHGVPCLVSDVTGTAAYIDEGVNGMVVTCGDATMLAEKIAWSILHADRLHDMGVKAREIFDAHFSMEVFERELLRVIQEVGI